MRRLNRDPELVVMVFVVRRQPVNIYPKGPPSQLIHPDTPLRKYYRRSQRKPALQVLCLLSRNRIYQIRHFSLHQKSGLYKLRPTEDIALGPLIPRTPGA